MNEERLVVTRYQPGQKWRRRMMFGVLIFLLMLASYFLGGQMFGNAMTEKNRLEQDNALQQERLDSAEEQINHLQVNAEVDREALEKARQNMMVLQQQIYQRDEELELYRNLLSDGDQPRGLSVTDVKLVAEADGRIRYRWVARQKTNEMKTLKVYADIVLLGRQSGEEVTVPLSDLDAAITQMPLALEYRYFQIQQGYLKLPEGFDPAKVRISLRYSWTKEPQFTREFDWKLEG